MEILPEPCDWSEFEKKQRRLEDTVSEKNEKKSLSTDMTSLEQRTLISISSDEEQTTDAVEEMSTQNRNGSLPSEGTNYSRMQPDTNETTKTLTTVPSKQKTDVPITPKPIEIAFSINQLTKMQDQVKKVHSAIPTTSFTIFCPTYNVNPEGIYLPSPSAFPSQPPMNPEFRVPLPIPQPCIKTVPIILTNPSLGSNCNEKPSTSLQGRRSGSSLEVDKPRRKYRRRSNAKVCDSSKEQIQEPGKRTAVTRPKRPCKSRQVSTLTTVSAMSGVKDGGLADESDCCFRKSLSCLPDASCSLQEFSADCPKCVAYAKQVGTLIKRLTAIANTPNDIISIFELKQLLVEMDNQNFTAIMIKLLEAFPREMVKHITA
ncbi:unnamed protein product [Rodentolepis nana]|uniref:Uncharacterized protein n=1 Tax=Rodentolepis nana TaxID=102285 RepID=A0A0R3T861_RODNA|nr:unnamed protein product [Rodentolepis nana]